MSVRTPGRMSRLMAMEAGVIHIITNPPSHVSDLEFMFPPSGFFRFSVGAGATTHESGSDDDRRRCTGYATCSYAQPPENWGHSGKNSDVTGCVWRLLIFGGSLLTARGTRRNGLGYTG